MPINDYMEGFQHGKPANVIPVSMEDNYRGSFLFEHLLAGGGLFDYNYLNLFFSKVFGDFHMIRSDKPQLNLNNFIDASAIRIRPAFSNRALKKLSNLENILKEQSSTLCRLGRSLFFTSFAYPLAVLYNSSETRLDRCAEEYSLPFIYFPYEFNLERDLKDFYHPPKRSIFESVDAFGDRLNTYMFEQRWKEEVYNSEPEDFHVHKKSGRNNCRGGKVVPPQFRSTVRNRRRSGDR